MTRTLIVLLCMIAGYQPLMVYAATANIPAGAQLAAARRKSPVYAPLTRAELQVLQTKASSDIALCHLAGGDCTRVCDKTDPVTHQPICHQQCDQPQASNDDTGDAIFLALIIGLGVLLLVGAAASSSTSSTGAALLAR